MKRIKRILIVEDDAATALVYRRSLEREGYEVYVATNGHAGLDFIKDITPDGVLLDLMMPTKTGMQVLKGIRACQHLAKIPVIVFTSAFIPLLLKEALVSGATEIYEKGKLTPQILVKVFAETIKTDQAA